MYKIFNLIVLVSFTIIGCADNENSSTSDNPSNSNANIILSSYNIKYSSTPQVTVDLNNNGNYLLEYKNSKVVKRIGGVLAGASGSGMGGYFSNNVYDTIIYSNNKIEIFTKIIPFGGMNQIVPNKKEFFLDSNQKILKKINYNSEYYISDNDTINFEYSNNKISRTFKFNPYENSVSSESFYNYNSNGNLESILTKEYAFNYDVDGLFIGKEYIYKIIETFEDYDSANNPFTKSGIFDNIYYRSLSNNNYRKYTFKKYSNPLGQNSLVGEQFSNYNINYDSSGNAIFIIN